ncbi:beta-1,4-xylosidase, partial [Reticulomyxa filosa]
VCFNDYKLCFFQDRSKDKIQFGNCCDTGLLDDQSSIKWNNYKHISLAYEMAVQSMVLLENVGNTLPFKRSEMNQTIWAIVGPCANNSVCYRGDYTAEPESIISPYLAFVSEFNASNVLYAPGCVDTACSELNPEMVDALLNVVKQADVVIYVGGISTQQETEGIDRSKIELPSNQSVLYHKMYD